MKTTKTRRRAAGAPIGWLIAAAIALPVVAGLAVWLASAGAQPAPGPAPEADKVQAVQATMPFQILIPAYLPREFERAAVQIKVDQAGPSGEPMVELAYRTRQGATVTFRQWVPTNPSLEIMAGSRPIETKWGKGWLLTQSTSLVVLWVDVGPLRVAAFTSNLNVLSREQVLQMADTLGPASNQQVFSFSVEQPTIKDVPPPPPFEVKVNDQGMQEVTLVVTPGGYSPLRFAVKKGVPVRLIFRQLGPVGCGNELIFPADPENPTALLLASESDVKVLEFTPQQAGSFQFHCAHQMYRGVLTVRE